MITTKSRGSIQRSAAGNFHSFTAVFKDAKSYISIDSLDCDYWNGLGEVFTTCVSCYIPAYTYIVLCSVENCTITLYLIYKKRVHR